MNDFAAAREHAVTPRGQRDGVPPISEADGLSASALVEREKELPRRGDELTDARMRLALRVSIIAWGSAPRRDRASVAFGPGAEVLLAGSARNPERTPLATR
jgi:hypothetical protein